MSWLDGTGLSNLLTALKSFIPDIADDGAAKKATSIPYGVVASTSTSTAFTATVDGIDELADGVCVMLKNGKVTSAEGCTLNVNGLGAKPIYQSMAAATAVTTTFNKNYTMLFVYDSTRVSGGCWVMHYGYNANTTYSAMTEAEMQTGTATNARSITAARLKQAVEYHAPVASVNGSTGAVTISVPTKTSDLTNDSNFVTANGIVTEVENNGANVISATLSGTTVSVDSSLYSIYSTYGGGLHCFFALAVSATDIVILTPTEIDTASVKLKLACERDGTHYEVELTASGIAATPMTGTLVTRPMLPSVASSDSGKFLTVDSSGQWVATSMQTWSGGSY